MSINPRGYIHRPFGLAVQCKTGNHWALLLGKQLCRLFLACAVLVQLALSQNSTNAQSPLPSWVASSNRFTKMLLDVRIRYSPEYASSQGLAEYDSDISRPTLADEHAERAERDAVVHDLHAQIPNQTDRNVLEDLDILLRAADLEDRDEDFSDRSEVPYVNASEEVFDGISMLLDDQVATERRAAAIARLKKYAGLESGRKPFTELLIQREQDQIKKTGMSYPARADIETQLGRNSNYLKGIPPLFKKYQLTGWEDAYAVLKRQLTDYDSWVRTNLLPKAREDFRLSPARYALNLQRYGIDIPPADIAARAHQAFKEYQEEMGPLAKQIALEHKLPSIDYRNVIATLKQQQLIGEAIVPVYERRLNDISAIIIDHGIVSLSRQTPIVRLASAAESAQAPAPHMQGIPLLNNAGERGEFVLPLNLPSSTGGVEDKYDDFTYEAVSWTLTAHEALPGHALQFHSMAEHGVSLARSQYALNSTNVEGWALYSEYLIAPYMPIEGRLISLQERMLRAARAFLDPELQSGKIQTVDAMHILEKDVVLSHGLAKEEVERYTLSDPGQAMSYFYGYSRLLELRRLTEKKLGSKFSQKRFHDFILSEGVLPLDLLQDAVTEVFVPRSPRAK